MPTSSRANEVTPTPEVVLRDALNWGITVYDAQYVTLAKQFGVQCVTEDGPVRAACPDIAVSLADFIRGTTGGSLVRETRSQYRVRRQRR